MRQDKKQMYERRAEVLQSMKEEARRVEADRLHEVSSALKTQVAEETALRNPSMNIHSCCLNPEELRSWASLATTPPFASKALEKLRKASLSCPSPLSHDEVSSDRARTGLSPSVDETNSVIYKEVATCRDEFQDAVFRVESEDGAQYFRFLVAQQNPVWIAFLVLHPVVLPEPALDVRPPSLADRAFTDFTMAWRYDIEDVAMHDIFGEAEQQQITFVPGSVFKAQRLLVTKQEWQSLGPALSGHVEREDIRRKQHRAERIANRITAPKRAEPERVDTTGAGASSSTASTDHEHTRKDTEDRANELDAEQVEAELERDYTDAYKQLEMQREDLTGTASEDRGEDFKWAVLGGAWNVERQGVVSYGLKVSIKPNTDMDEFITRFNMGRSISFTYRVHAEKDSELLAR
eukprot:6479829-Amphidinium_carterae.1